MGDVGDAYNELKVARKAKRRQNLESSTQILQDNNIQFKSLNDGVHLVVSTSLGNIDFWPSTGLFKTRYANMQGRGVYKLIEVVRRA